MLSQLHLRLHLMVVAVAALVVAAHRVAVAELREHRPLHIAEVELRAEVGSERSTAPQMRVAVDAEVGGVGVVLVADELRAHQLHELDVHASLRRREVVARVVDGSHARTEVESLRAFAAKQFFAVELSAAHIVEVDGRTDEEVVGGAYQPVGFELRLPALHLALVGVLVAHVVAPSPDVAREGVEIDRVVEAVGVARELMCAAHAEHVEAHGRDVAEERHVARSRERVGRV